MPLKKTKCNCLLDASYSAVQFLEEIEVSTVNYCTLFLSCGVRLHSVATSVLFSGDFASYSSNLHHASFAFNQKSCIDYLVKFVFLLGSFEN
jgi:hypothetical protein